ncbi:MAG: S8 family serine peptidase, partial [Ignavibacteriaceae bacterium]|nr:S8 family serine peptidase [Ignavibacteriaceae bacterium]
MNFKIPLFLILFVISFSTLFSQSNTFFIKYYSNVSKTEIETKVTTDQFIPETATLQLQAEVLTVDHLANGLVVNDEILGSIIKVTIDKEVDQFLLDQIKNSDVNIEYIQEANIYSMDVIPNDTMITQQWALEKIKAFDAWDKTQGSEVVLLGIIDTGIDYFHPDLENKLYINPGETGIDNNGEDKRSNGVDDDNNGFVDDYRGWDFTDRVGFPFDSTGGDYLDWDNDPMDEQGHGTYISGIAIAEVNNVTGIAGVAPNLKMINLRAFDPSGFGEEDDVAAAILYAVQMGVKVINMSFGDNAFSLVLRDVIRFAYSQDVVLVGSAGNSGSSNPHYPSGYSEVISVGNSTIDDFVAGNSNFGSTLDLVAPGSLILTTSRNNNYAVISGTSAATPHVTAAAGLILSIQDFTNEEIKQILKSSTDDIGSPGWDLRSGAGRLNLFKAVTVVAPSIIKFNHPTQDFATLEDELTINATVLSPLFSFYDLYFGTGLNPENWTPLIENGLTQFSSENIYTLDLLTLPDSVYTLRLVVQFTNGRTMEERVNFFISRTPPVAELFSVGPAFYGDKTTIMAAMYTDEPSITRMYYKRPSEIDYNFITLDGFTINNQFVKYLHYGFIPKQLVEQNAVYEVYFEAENLVGLTTILNNSGLNYIFITNYDAELSGEIEMPFSLPAGDIFHDPVNLTSNDLNEVYIREFTNSRISNLYKFNNNTFTFVDSLSERIIRDFGDFNNNGLKDLLTFFVRDGFIFEQGSTNSSVLNQKFSDESGEFWPIMADDIDGDNQTEIVVVKNDTSVNVWKVNNDLSVSNPQEMVNFTTSKFGSNILTAPNSVIADINGDGTNELWFVDLDGDIYSYNILGPDNYQPGNVIETGFLGSTAFITAGDYNGDLVDELAVLLHSVGEIDIAPFYLLKIFNLAGNNPNTIYEQILIDAASEFSSSFQQSENSVRFSDIDNDGFDELILFMFPYSYIFKDQFGSDKIISFKENINSNAIFIGDLN